MKCTKLKLIPIVLAAFAGNAGAEELSFEDRVRAYLLENPEVILEALTILTEREEAEATRVQLAAYPELFTDEASLGMGEGDAPIRVIKFFDYKCAPCKAVRPVLVDFVETNPDVRVEMRHLPILTPGSEWAARFALAAQAVGGDGVYEQVHEKLWDVRGPLNNAGFEAISQELGLDFAEIEPVMDSDEITARIDYNRDLAISLEILGTPAFVTPETVTIGVTDIAVLSETWFNQ